MVSDIISADILDGLVFWIVFYFFIWKELKKLFEEF